MATLVVDTGEQTLTNKTLTSPVLQGDVGGWVGANETWTYSSVDDPTGILTVPTDATTKYSVGMRISFVNATNTIYGIITAVTATTMTFLHEIDPTDSLALTLMANSAITAPKYSTQKAPFGFPLDPDKWTVEFATVAAIRHAVPGDAVADTWYNGVTPQTIDIPIGIWNVSYEAVIKFNHTAAEAMSVYVTLSTANNSETDTAFTDYYGNTNVAEVRQLFSRSGVMVLATKDAYYLNVMRADDDCNNIVFSGDYATLWIRAICAYL